MRLHIIRTCACGHGRGAHEHYRRGTDCSACEGCRAWHGRVSVSLRVVADEEQAVERLERDVERDVDDEPAPVEVGVLDGTAVSVPLEQTAPVVALEEGTLDAELLDDVLAAASAADGAIEPVDVEQVSDDLRLGAA